MKTPLSESLRDGLKDLELEGIKPSDALIEDICLFNFNERKITREELIARGIDRAKA